MSPRAYKSTQRERSAVATREAILNAAGELFVTVGFRATTISDIATRAEVAVTTVYGSVGSKAQIVLGLLENGTSHPSIPQTLVDVEASSATDEAIGYLAHGVCLSMEELLPLVSVMYDTAPSEPLIAEAVTAAEESWRNNLRGTVTALENRGWLGADRTAAEALDILWFYFGPTSLRALRSMGWSWEKIESWLATQAYKALQK